MDDRVDGLRCLADWTGPRDLLAVVACAEDSTRMVQLRHVVRDDRLDRSPSSTVRPTSAYDRCGGVEGYLGDMGRRFRQCYTSGLFGLYSSGIRDTIAELLEGRIRLRCEFNSLSNILWQLN